MVLADGKDDRLADFAADRVAQGVFQERLAQELVGGVRKEAPLELALLESLLLILAGVIGERDNEAFLGKQRGGDLGAGVHHRRVDQEALLHAIKQRVAEGRLAVLAAKGAVGVEKEAGARPRAGRGCPASSCRSAQVIARGGGEAQPVADEPVVEHGAGYIVTADGAVAALRVGDDVRSKVGRARKSFWFFILVIEASKGLPRW